MFHGLIFCLVGMACDFASFVEESTKFAIELVAEFEASLILTGVLVRSRRCDLWGRWYGWFCSRY